MSGATGTHRFTSGAYECSIYMLVVEYMKLYSRLRSRSCNYHTAIPTFVEKVSYYWIIYTSRFKKTKNVSAAIEFILTY